jgi:hypothetical protein
VDLLANFFSSLSAGTSALCMEPSAVGKIIVYISLCCNNHNDFDKCKMSPLLYVSDFVVDLCLCSYKLIVVFV